MINLDETASRGTWLGRSLRWPLDRLPKTMVMPILSGPLRARRWIVGAGIHRCWLGTYERQKQRALLLHLKNGATAYDIGANAGFYTLLMSRRVGPRGCVYAFEPEPGRLQFLRRHLELNGLNDVSVRGEAVSDFAGEAHFSAEASGYQGRLDTAGTLRVPVVTLDQLLKARRIEPADLIKIDVEGAELSVLRGAETFLRRSRPTLFLATHSPELHRNCCEFLRACGYQLQTIGGSSDVSGADEIIATER